MLRSTVRSRDSPGKGSRLLAGAKTTAPRTTTARTRARKTGDRRARFRPGSLARAEAEEAAGRRGGRDRVPRGPRRHSPPVPRPRAPGGEGSGARTIPSCASRRGC